jgi:cytochrome c
MQSFKCKRWVENSKKFAKIQKKATHKNYLRGKKLFEQKCAMCHGKNGEGNRMFPPLWGKNSYNAGAGMSKLNKGADGFNQTCHIDKAIRLLTKKLQI